MLKANVAFRANWSALFISIHLLLNIHMKSVGPGGAFFSPRGKKRNSINVNIVTLLQSQSVDPKFLESGPQDKH